MINITRLHIHYRDLKDKDHVKKIKPTDRTSSLTIKRDIASVISKLKHDAEYYYVVMEITTDGEPRYRTIVPKTFLQG